MKNISSLGIRIFEINSLAYYKAELKGITSDIELDGLIPKYSRNIKFDKSPALKFL